MAGGGLWPLRGCARWGSLRKGWRVLGWHSGACAKDEQNGPQKGTGDLLGACDAVLVVWVREVVAELLRGRLTWDAYWRRG